MNTMHLYNKKKGDRKLLCSIELKSIKILSIKWKRIAGKDIPLTDATGEISVAELLNCPKKPLAALFGLLADTDLANIAKGINDTYLAGEYKDKANYKKFLECLEQANQGAKAAQATIPEIKQAPEQPKPAAPKQAKTKPPAAKPDKSKGKAKPAATKPPAPDPKPAAKPASITPDKAAEMLAALDALDNKLHADLAKAKSDLDTYALMREKINEILELATKLNK